MSRASLGNILGELTAERDGRMLADAFFESRSFQELALGHDFRFVVGRRGSGKSALFQKVSEALSRESGVLIVKEHPQEEKAVAFNCELSKLTTDYRIVRTITRLTWRTQILSSAIELILNHYRSNKVEHREQLKSFKEKHKTLFAQIGLARSLEALRLVRIAKPGVEVGLLPEAIADYFSVRELQHEIAEALQTIKKRILFFYDGLDEGWVPTPVATGVLGGLAKAATEFREDAQGVQCMLFVRDNMMRALAEFDDDYTRNIEGNTLRLQWSEESLLSLVALRIRAALKLSSEQDIRAWNRFAERGLDGKPGFRKCLQLTLYRPRDVIALLNNAYQDATRMGRTRIIEEDVEMAATKISQTRLADLYKEYEVVLPGLQQFASSFTGHKSHAPYFEIRAHLDSVIEHPHSPEAQRDFALLSTGAEAFNALYSVGFFGVEDPKTNAVRFCHDGSNTDVQELAGNAVVVVHPCFWRALSITDTGADVLVRVDDEDDFGKTFDAKKPIQDLRLRRLGRVVEELNRIPIGVEGAHAFEEWVLTTSRYLFAKGLDNITWNPNPGALQRRDIVGANRAESGFWKRLERIYGVSQFVIECKNYSPMTQDEFRQAWGYLGGPYGNCLMVVTRSEEDRITDAERLLVMEGYNGQPRKLVLLLPANLLHRALRKMRSQREGRDDYVDDLLSRRLDTFERSYVSPKAPRPDR